MNQSVRNAFTSMSGLFKLNSRQKIFKFPKVYTSFITIKGKGLSLYRFYPFYPGTAEQKHSGKSLIVS